MSKRRKIVLWVGLALSLPAGGYAALSFFFYVWLEASKQWAPERASIWALGSLIVAVAFLGVFVYCLVSLIREANRAYRKEQRAT